jgi:hypothetical protein
MGDLTAGRRLLFLDGTAETRVRLDGSALAVRNQGMARQWYPLRLLSRVISRPRIVWEGPAIVALMEAGIPLFFLDGDGKLAGACLGRFDDRTGLGAHLASLIALPDWPARYENWLRSQERRILHHLHEALGWPLADLRREVARARLDLALQQRLGTPWASRLHPLMGMLRGDVIREFAETGIDADVIAGLRGQATLAKDVTALAGWALRGRVAADEAMPAADTRGLIGYYEQTLRARLLPTVRRVIASLWKLRVA